MSYRVALSVSDFFFLTVISNIHSGTHREDEYICLLRTLIGLAYVVDHF